MAKNDILKMINTRKNINSFYMYITLINEFKNYFLLSHKDINNLLTKS
jgi:hypothetical protein